MLPGPTYTLPHCPCQGGQGGKEGDLHEEPLAEDKRSPETNPSCGHRGRTRDATAMAWAPLLLPLLTLCTGASSQALPAGSAPQDPELDPPQTLSSVQHSPKTEPVGHGSLALAFPPFPSYRLCGLLRADPVLSLASGLGRDGQDHLHRGFTG